MTKMTKIISLCVTLLVLASIDVANAQQPGGIKRTPLQKIEFPEGYTTVTGMAEIAPGGSAGRHTHPGIETGYVLEGESDLIIDGQPTIRLKAGDSYQIPAGAVHDAKVIGDKPLKLIGIYITKRGEPMATPAPAK